jgi:predicted SnoaL-like aldol condensation-catalyzing enzyme
MPSNIPSRCCQLVVTHAYLDASLWEIYGGHVLQAQVASDLFFNKRLARDCLDVLFNQHNPERAVEQYIGENYRQHNPEAPDGPGGVIAYASSYVKANPQAHIEFKRIIAEGHLVAVHSHLKSNSSDLGMAVVDIFRVEDHKLVEHWDVRQPIPSRAKNKNTMF